MKLLALTISATICYLYLPSTTAAVTYPVMLVPGVLSTVLEAKQKNNRFDQWCLPPRWAGFRQVWWSLININPFEIACYVRMMKIQYDDNAGKSISRPTITVRVKRSDETFPVEWVHPWIRLPFFEVYHSMVKSFEDDGYVDEESMFGMGYDWRINVQDNDDFLAGAKSKLELSYSKNNKATVIICHSMGCPFIYYFLTQQTAAWKAQYVRALVGIGAPWGGSAIAAANYITDNSNQLATILSYMHSVIITTSANAGVLMANPNTFGSDILVSSPTKNYTASDMQQFLIDLGLSDAVKMFNDHRTKVAPVLDTLGHPGVDTFCVMASGHDTISGVIYETDITADSSLFDRNDWSFTYTDGDGAVPNKSGDKCKQWNNTAGFSFEFEENDLSHAELIRNSAMTNRIKNYINALP